ncbi:MAG: amidase [Melioribacteraceae bacterium]|nr:MAG: amidase [Melioribacteraceae bacterium]
MKINLAMLIRLLMLILLLWGCEAEETGIKPNPDILNNTEPLINVRIINTLEEIKVKFHGSWSIENSTKSFSRNDGIIVTQVEGYVVFTDKNGENITSDEFIVLKPETKRTELEIAGVPYGVGWWWEGKENRKYEGIVSFYPTPSGKPEVIISLPMEEYLKGVVPYEIGGDSPLEALKAQAVAARSEAVIALKSDMYRGPNHDLTSDVECQVFSGNNRRTQYSDEAVRATRGIILTNDGKPINAYYASNCGGHSELIENVWPDRPRPESYKHTHIDSDVQNEMDLISENGVTEWIKSKPEVYCNPENGINLPEWSQKNFRWERKFKINELSEMLNPEQNLGAFIGIKPLKRGVSGRIIKAEILFEKDTITTKTELELRQLFKPSLRSSCFIVEKENNEVIIKGAGWGHGVGMCQSGAVSMAHTNSTFQEILEHYYTNAVLNIIY